MPSPEYSYLDDEPAAVLIDQMLLGQQNANSTDAPQMNTLKIPSSHKMTVLLFVPTYRYVLDSENERLTVCFNYPAMISSKKYMEEERTMSYA